MFINGVNIPDSEVKLFKEEHRVKQSLLIARKYNLTIKDAAYMYGCNERNYYRLLKKYKLNSHGV